MVRPARKQREARQIRQIGESDGYGRRAETPAYPPPAVEGRPGSGTGIPASNTRGACRPKVYFGFSSPTRIRKPITIEPCRMNNVDAPMWSATMPSGAAMIGIALK